jgi:Glycosyltransferase (GlcNAc)
MKTIFVSIANYKDPEVFNTVNELITKQSGDNRVNICVFSQIDLRDDSFDALDEIPQVEHVKVDYRLAKGVCWARAQAQKYYRGEDYYLQIDSHIVFTENWDRLLIQDHEMALGYGRKAVLTAYPCAYEFNEEGERFIPHRSATRFDMNVVNIIPSAAARFEADVDLPEQEYFIAGGFFFTTGDFIENVPYDEELFFVGEEITLAIRAYTAGYLIFSPTKFICAHLYQVAQKKNEKRPVFWDKAEDRGRDLSWTLRDRTSKIKASLICRGVWFGKYGIQNFNLYKEFAVRIALAHPVVNLDKVIIQ